MGARLLGVVRAGAPFVVMLWAASTCGPEVKVPIPKDVGARWAEAFCAASFECGCEIFYASQDACVVELTTLQRELDGLLDATYNASCFEWAEARLLEACEVDFDAYVAQGSASESCVLAQGNAGVGEPCGDYDVKSRRIWGMFAFTDCREGLVCVEGKCQTAPAESVIMAMGEPCDPAFVSPKPDPRRVCHEPDQPVFCTNEGICAPRSGPGGACDAVLGCDASYCHASGVCVEQSQVGEHCEPLLDPSGATQWWGRLVACRASFCGVNGRCLEPGPALCVHRG